MLYKHTPKTASPYKFHLPVSLTDLLNKMNQPEDIGSACGTLLHNIRPLVTQHLSQNDANFNSDPPKTQIPTQEFTTAIDAHLARVRSTEDYRERFPNRVAVLERDSRDSKERRKDRLYVDRCINSLEVGFKTWVRENLEDVFRGWGGRQTQLFNRGVDRALHGALWLVDVYPEENVVLEARGGKDWKEWLRERCEERGRRIVSERRGEDEIGYEVRVYEGLPQCDEVKMEV